VCVSGVEVACSGTGGMNGLTTHTHTCVQLPSPAGESSDSSGGSPFTGVARDLLKKRRSYQEHRSFLESFSKYREVKLGESSWVGGIGRGIIEEGIFGGTGAV